MFCTGGIRCEKASSYMQSQGFREVYHLKGGILKYLEEVPKEQSKWQGECFVFDHRVAVGQGLVPSEMEMCHGCRMPLDAGRQVFRILRRRRELSEMLCDLERKIESLGAGTAEAD